MDRGGVVYEGAITNYKCPTHFGNKVQLAPVEPHKPDSILRYRPPMTNRSVSEYKYNIPSCAEMV